MLDIRDLMNLKEAYNAVYAPQELTEDQVWEGVEEWVNALLEEGYDLSDYTWEEMYEEYINEDPFKWNPNSNIVAAKGGKLGIMDKNNPNSWREPNEQEKGEVPLSSTSKFGSSAAGQKFIQQRDAAKSPSGTTSPTPKVAPKPAATKPVGSAMDQFAKANPKLAASAAERDRTRGTSATTNPLMKDMKSRLPAPKTPLSTTAPSPVRNGFGVSAAPIAAKASVATSTGSSTTPKPTPAATGSKKPGSIVSGFDMFDVVKGYLIDEGYADTEEAALAIMINMSEEWREGIIEAEVLSKKGGVEGTGVGKDFKARSWTDTEKSRYSSYKKPTAPTATPAAAQKNNEFTKSDNIKQKDHTPGTVAGADGNYRPQSAKDKFYRSISSKNAADDVISWNKYDRNDPKVKQAAKDWADTHYRQNTALDTNDPNYNPRSTKYPDFSKFKRVEKSPRQSFDKL